jgi:peptidyl-dipeptidase Dcp
MWDGPYGGTPPWNSVDSKQFEAAFKTAIELENADLQAIVDQTESPSFANTIVAMEKSGQALERLESIYHVHTGNLNVGPMADIEAQIEPLLSAQHDAVMQNAPLFERVRAVYESSDAKVGLSDAENRLLEKTYKSFVRQGALLDADRKKELSLINTGLASLFTRFSQNVLKAEQQSITINDRAKLQGLPEEMIASLELPDGSAKERWSIANTRSAIEPVLTYVDDRSLREQAWRTFYNRCDNGGELDNNETVSAILRLRAKRAKLLGYPTHAHWRLEPQMAKTPEQAMQLMDRVWQGALNGVRQEVKDMQAIVDSDGGQFQIEPWDYRYYAEKVRKQKYDLDLTEVKPYLQLEKLREGMMWAASEMFGLEFDETETVEVFHQDVRVWEVKKESALIGLWYFDPFVREGKHSGAWMTEYRNQANIDSTVLPLVSNNSNFLKGKPGAPVLISWDDAVTLFHEFGHALHGLCSQCKYPSQSGTSVATDFVEFPSQLFESWLSTPEVLSRFARHHRTGKPIPAALIEKIEKTATFNQGFATAEYLASAIVDMELHLAGDVAIDPAQFEKQTLAKMGMPKQIVMRHRTPHFSHVFSSDFYSAGYYSYLWAEALTADAAEAFETAGFFDSSTTSKLLSKVLAVGDTVDPVEAFREFRGRDVDPSALFRKRGFPVEERD